MGWRSRLLNRSLPPALSLPIRSRWGFSREPEMDLLPRFVNAGDVVLDVGSHLGIYAYRLSQLVGPEGKVVCFEPQPHLADYLRSGFRGRRFGNVEVIAEGLSDRAGTAWMSIPIEGQEPNFGRASIERRLSDRGLDVPVSRLDDLEFEGQLTFIKCDVEGHELSVLLGGEALLARHEPALLVEIEYDHAGEQLIETFQFLALLGYTPFYRDGLGVLRELPAPESLGAQNVNRPNGEEYVGNFLFLAHRHVAQSAAEPR